MAEIDYKPVFRELQKEVASILSESQYFKDRNITVLCEDSLEIEFEIKKALGSQGLVAVINMLQASYLGHDGMVNAYQIDNLELDIVENPSVWRPYLKKKGIQDGTTTDIMQMAAEILGGPQSGIFGRFNPKSIEIGEDSDLVVGKAKFQTTVRQNVEGVIPEPGQPEIPFITRVDLKELLDEIDYLKNLIEGFSTEEIKQDIEDLKTADSELGARIDGLGDIYQPKGSYALTSELEPYALKTQIPVNTSQLNNDTGFLTQVSWDEIIQKPDVALASDIPTKTSELLNDNGYLTAVNYVTDVFNKPDFALRNELPTKTSDLINDSGFITELPPTSDFATKTDLRDAIRDEADIRSGEDSRLEAELELKANISSLDEYAKKTLLEETVNEEKTARENSEQLINQRIDEKPDLSDIPTKTSQLVNDSITVESIGGVRAHNGKISGSLTIGEHVENYGNVYISEGDFEAGGTIAVSGGSNSGGVINVTGIDADVKINGKSVLTENDLPEIPTKTSQLNNDSGFITENDIPAIPTRTSQLLNDSGFLTEHQSLENYATKNYVDTQPVDADRIVNWPDFAYNGEVNMKFTEISDRVTSVEGAVQAIPENINKVYGQYKARYIDGDRQYFEMGEDGYVKAGTLALKSEMPANTSQLVNDSGYLTEVRYSDIIGKPVIPTKTSQLENDSGYVANVYWNDIPDKPVIPTRTSQLVNDSGFLNEVSWNDIQQKPSIPTKTSELINDSGFKNEVYWADLKEVPDLATQMELDASIRNTEQKLSLKLDKADYDDNEIFSQNRMRKIDGDGNVYEGTLTPGHYTEWAWSDGLQHDFGIIETPIQERILFAIVIMGDPERVCPEHFDSQEEAQSFIDTATEIEFSGSGVESITATREYIPDETEWAVVDQLALKSEIVESEGITEDECRSIVEGYGYQTSDDVETAITSKGYRTESQVESQITSKGYRTESQVESQITAKGYQTEQQVRSIASTVLPAGYSETILTGTLEDGTEMSFTILTKANS